jgi:alkanesulfonate monooxygenase SsuD/methylene tetrahydromethanopterin reductase-like flavin-dependent oxidoreductase (luciferase family)
MSMDFYMIHLMPYIDDVATAELRDAESAWVTFPNGLYNPSVGQLLYNRYLDELEHAEELGFDGVCVNEHHQNAYGTMPAPNIMAACLVRRTSRMKIALLGNAIGLHGHPARVAEEVAMLDVISGGRIISGFVRGIGDEYSSLNVDPTESRDRFNEAYELIMKAWSTPEPFQWNGRFWKYRYVNVWPQPIQKPPPIWAPGAGSPETYRWVARERYTWMSVFMPDAVIKTWTDSYRKIAEEEFDYTLDPKQIASAMPVFVGETDKQAHEEARPHLEWLFKLGLKHKPEQFFPPGYISPGAMRAMMRLKLKLPDEVTYEDMIDEGYVLVGSPETVREGIARYQETLNLGVLVPLLQIGDMPHDRTLRNMELFATEVIPHFKESA